MVSFCLPGSFISSFWFRCQRSLYIYLPQIISARKGAQPCIHFFNCFFSINSGLLFVVFRHPFFPWADAFFFYYVTRFDIFYLLCPFLLQWIMHLNYFDEFQHKGQQNIFFWLDGCWHRLLPYLSHSLLLRWTNLYHYYLAISGYSEHTVLCSF